MFQERFNANFEPEVRWFKYGVTPLGQSYGSLLRYNLRLEKSGGDIEDAFPQVYPRADEVERLLRLAEEKGYFPKTSDLLRSLERIVQNAENSTLEILEEEARVRSERFKNPAPPLGLWQEIVAILDDALYGGTVEAGEAVYSVSEVEESILPLLYLRHSLFGEPLPVCEVEKELKKLWSTFGKRFPRRCSASARFGDWLEQYSCVGYLTVDPLSGSFWNVALGFS